MKIGPGMGSETQTRILLVEDDPGVARLEQLRLERAGYTVVAAATAEEGLMQIAAGGIELIVLDQGLDQELNGLDFFRKVKQAGHNVPAILVTGLQTENLVVEALRAGVRDFVPKTPIFLNHLEPVVTRVLQQVRTERELAESRIVAREHEAQRRKLEHEVAQRRRVEQALKDADRRKDQFLAMLAHELRNPLAPISNAVQIMRLEGPNGPNFQWSLEVIEDQIKHMTRMIDDLLDVSRITRGTVELQKEPIELAQVVELAVEASQPLIQDYRHDLTITLPEQPILLEVDPPRLAQVLANLLNNAAKYTSEGGKITLFVERAGGEAIIHVRDNGIGIPAELLPKVFDLFIQADQTLSRSRGGLGIGLTLVRSLVELHGGSVSAQSDGPGHGSEFVIRLPVATTPHTGSHPDSRAERGHEIQPPRRRILVVDDNLKNASSLDVLLRALGQEVYTAHDGQTALTLARQVQPDIVLLDIGLPVIDGYEVARLCRIEPGLAHVTLVAMTGYGQEEDRRRSQEAGFNAHLVKPVTAHDLRLLLNHTGASLLTPWSQ
jgi:signal transduction histidine kinase